MVGKPDIPNFILPFLRAAITLAALGALCCHESTPANTKAIYGNDDRVEVAEAVARYPETQAIAAATYLLLDKSELHAEIVAGQPSFRLKGRTYGATFNLCPDERFFYQPVNGFCTGVLVGRNMLLTASHCIRSATYCSDVRILSRYQVDSDGRAKSTFSEQEVYSCKSITLRVSDGRRKQDLLLIELDRPVTDGEPVDVERGQENPRDLFMVGFPRGLPKKVVTAGQLTAQTTWTATADLDASVGNSGSPIVGADSGHVLGVLSRGAADFAADGSCMREKRCNSDSCSGETLTLVHDIADYIPTVAAQLQVHAMESRELTGNHNANIEPGESHELRLSFENIGANTLQDGTWNLIAMSPGVRLLQGHGRIDNLAWNQKSDTQRVFLHLNEDAGCDQPFKFQLQTSAGDTSTVKPFMIFPGTETDFYYEAVAAPLPLTSRELAVDLPAISVLTQIYPYIEVRHPQVQQLQIAVALPGLPDPTMDRYWYIQQLPDIRPAIPSDAPVHRIFGQNNRAFQDINQIERPIAAGTWYLRFDDFSASAAPGGVRGSIVRAGFLVRTRGCS